MKKTEDQDNQKVPNLPQSYAEQFVKDWSVKAQWTDREEETSKRRVGNLLPTHLTQFCF